MMKVTLTAIGLILVLVSTGYASDCPTPSEFREEFKKNARTIAKGMDQDMSSFSIPFSQANVTLKSTQDVTKQPLARFQDVKTTCIYLVDNVPVFEIVIELSH